MSQVESKKLTIEDIAKAIGCSKTTVSRAISGKGRIGNEMRQKILAYCDEFGYKPNVIAKGLAQSKTFNIGVILLGEQDIQEIPFFQNCLLGICDTAANYDYDVVVTTIRMDDISRLVRIVKNHKVDGIILTRLLTHDVQVEYLKTCSIPFVVIGSSEEKGITQIDNHHVEACREMTSVLCKQQVGRIAFIGSNSSHVVSQKRYQGFVEGCEMNGVKPENELISLDCNSKALVEKAVLEAIQAECNCILCMDDRICTQVLLKLTEEHVRVPEDVKVASFYNSNFLEAHNPPITSLKFDVQGLGEAACQVLLGKIAGDEVPHKTLLGYEISLKDSTKVKR